jgi:hypothetical protein
MDKYQLEIFLGPGSEDETPADLSFVELNGFQKALKAADAARASELDPFAEVREELALRTSVPQYQRDLSAARESLTAIGRTGATVRDDSGVVYARGYRRGSSSGKLTPRRILEECSNHGNDLAGQMLKIASDHGIELDLDEEF